MTLSSPSRLPPALFERRIIQAMRLPGDLSQVLELGLPAAIMLKGDIFDVERVMNQGRGKLAILLHIDLMEGRRGGPPG